MRLFSERCGMGNEEEPHACIQLFTRLNCNSMLPQVTYVKCRQTSVAKRPRDKLFQRFPLGPSQLKYESM